MAQTKPVARTTKKHDISITKNERKRHASSELFDESKRLCIISSERFKFTEPGIVLTLGDGDTGQLGLGADIMERKRPALVPGLPKDVVQVCAGGMHTVCLTKDGKVWTFGCNDESALGRSTQGDDDAEMSPALVEMQEDLGHVIMVSAGDSHTAALNSDGKLYIWGTFRDSNGVLGLRKPGEISPKPVQVHCREKIAKVVSGTDHIAFLTTSGAVYTFGCGEQGQLGRISSMSSGRASRRGVESLLLPSEIRPPRKTTFSNLWAGNYATVALCSATSTVLAWGLNNYCQLGLADGENRFFPQPVKEFALAESWSGFALGQHHSLALTGSGEVFAVGRGDYGRLGFGNSEHVNVPTRVPGQTDCASVACGIACSFDVKKDGTAFSWGMGSNKQLGHGNEEDAESPTQMIGKNLENKHVLMVSAGGQHTAVLIKDEESTANDP